MENKLRPAIELAIARTVMANERSLLAYVRTALGCFLGGAGLFKFFGHPVYEIVGIMLIFLHQHCCSSGSESTGRLKS